MASLQRKRPPRIVKDLAGQQFHRWTVLRLDRIQRRGNQWVKFWFCRCECGSERAVQAGSLTSGASKSCGCWDSEVSTKRNATAREDITGHRFGRWLVLGLGERRGKRRLWECRCDCGTVRHLSARSLKRKDGKGTTSCGCLKRERVGSRFRRHGRAKSREYRIWKGMMGRCYNKDVAQFSDYGGRGIRVCERWHDFACFFEDMGEAPSPKHSLDRFPNQNGNYEPDNCRWATFSEQNNNKRNNRILTYQGRSQSVAMWARELSTTSAAIINRKRRGWSDEKTITTPFRVYLR